MLWFCLLTTATYSGYMHFMGRKSTFNQDTADRICERLAGGESLSAICLSDDMPPRKTVSQWVEDNKQFSACYARAREIGYDLMAEEILVISDDSKHDVEVDENGQKRMNAEYVARSRLRVDTRKWLLAKMLPKKYGDRVEQHHTGDADRPVS